MNCPKCGAQVSDGAVFCGHCGELITGAKGPEVNGVPYLVLGILETLLCCWLAAIPAIVFAAKILSCNGSGDREGAAKNAERARLWLIISAAAGIVVTAVFLAAAAPGIMQGNYGSLSEMLNV